MQRRVFCCMLVFEAGEDSTLPAAKTVQAALDHSTAREAIETACECRIADWSLDEVEPVPPPLVPNRPETLLDKLRMIFAQEKQPDGSYQPARDKERPVSTHEALTEALPGDPGIVMEPAIAEKLRNCLGSERPKADSGIDLREEMQS